MKMCFKILKEENMKKLVVLLALLAMSQVAGAAIMLTAGGEVTEAITLNASDSIMIGFNGDGQDAPGAFFLGVVVDGPGTLDLSAVGSQNIGYGGNAGNIAAGMDGEIAGMLGIKVPYADISLQDVVTGNPAPLTGVLVKDLAFHCDGAGLVLIRVFDGGGNLLDTLEISQVPEPMTLGLLGLGGLFLRRRLA
jgi:hypothetical protein